MRSKARAIAAYIFVPVFILAFGAVILYLPYLLYHLYRIPDETTRSIFMIAYFVIAIIFLLLQSANRPNLKQAIQQLGSQPSTPQLPIAPPNPSTLIDPSAHPGPHSRIYVRRVGHSKFSKIFKPSKANAIALPSLYQVDHQTAPLKGQLVDRYVVLNPGRHTLKIGYEESGSSRQTPAALISGVAKYMQSRSDRVDVLVNLAPGKSYDLIVDGLDGQVKLREIKLS